MNMMSSSTAIAYGTLVVQKMKRSPVYFFTVAILPKTGQPVSAPPRSAMTTGMTFVGKKSPSWSRPKALACCSSMPEEKTGTHTASTAQPRKLVCRKSDASLNLLESSGDTTASAAGLPLPSVTADGGSLTWRCSADSSAPKRLQALLAKVARMMAMTASGQTLCPPHAVPGAKVLFAGARAASAASIMGSSAAMAPAAAAMDAAAADVMAEVRAAFMVAALFCAIACAFATAAFCMNMD